MCAPRARPRQLTVAWRLDLVTPLNFPWLCNRAAPECGQRRTQWGASMTRLGQGGGRKTAIRTANCVVAAAAVLVWGFSQSAFAANPQDAQDAGFNTGAVGPYMLATFLDYSLNSDNDPFGDYTSIRDKGTTATSAAGIFSGPTATAHTTDAGGGTDAFYNASKIFNLGANQQVIFGGMYRYDSSRTTYSSNSPASIGAGNTVNSSTNTFAGLATYRVGDTYLRGGLGGIWGSGTWTNTIGGVSGHSDSDGYVATVALGKVFTLLDTRTAPHSTLPVKAPPKSAAGGYALQLDLSAHLAYASEDIGGFTDQTGFIRGDETLHFGMAGGQARLFATVPDGRVTWIPYVAGTVDQQFGYSHTLTFPVQPAFAFPGDVVSYGDAQTFWGGQVGIAAQDVSGFVLGVHGFYTESAEYQIAGVQAYVRYRFPQ